MSKVIHFEIPADDPERAIKFYEDIFGWEIVKWEHGDYWLVSTGPDDEPGINGAIMPKKDDDMVRDTISVYSIEEFAKKIESQGGKMLSEKNADSGYGV
jgi:predicted enzyme related to lactoylglutathione lyase